jgi:hypothetical protein
VPPRRTIRVGNPVQLLSAPALGQVVAPGGERSVQPFAGTYTADQDVVADAVVRAEGRVVRTIPAGTVRAARPSSPGTACATTARRRRRAVQRHGHRDGRQRQHRLGGHAGRGAPRRPRAVARAVDRQRADRPGDVPLPGGRRRQPVRRGAARRRDRPVGTVTQPQPGVFEATADVGARLGDGTHQLVLSARWATGTTPAGLVHPWEDPITVKVDDRPVVEDLPAPRYITPNGDGDGDDYLGRYRTMTAGLRTTQWLTSASGATVRTLVDGVPSRGQASGACPRARPSAPSGLRPRALGRQGRRGPARARRPLHAARARAEQLGQAAERTATIGVERRSPLTVDLAPGSSVAERQDLAYTPRPGLPRGATGPATITSVKVGVQRQTELRDAVLEGGVYRISFDLPSTYPAEFAFEERATWRDQFGGEHRTVTPLPVVHDGRTLNIRLSTSRQRGPEPLVQTFTVEGFREDGGRVDWVLDPGNGTEPITGHLDHPYEPVRVPFTYPVRGVYEAKITATAAGGTAKRHAGVTMYVDDRPPATPAVSWTVDPASGVAPVDATATLTVSGEDGAANSYSVDWGDGQTPPATSSAAASS